jgi:hypothetical protein
MSFRALLSFDEVERGAHPVCERCEVLVKALQNAKYRLDYAMSQMSALGAEKPDMFHAALLETQSLRMDCRALRVEVEHHKTVHFSVSTQE